MSAWLMNPWAVGVGTPLLVAAILGVTRGGRALLKAAWHRLPRRSRPFPSRTLALHPEVDGLWWGTGTVSEKPAMQVVAKLHVANLTNERVEVRKVYLDRPRTDHDMVVVRHPTRDEFGDYPVLPGEKSEISILMWIVPPVRRPGENLKATIVVVDQYGNEHRLRRVTFRSEAPKQ